MRIKEQESECIHLNRKGRETSKVKPYIRKNDKERKKGLFE